MLVVGLGNPGQGYEHTRHNVGFRVVEQFVADHRGSLDVLQCQSLTGALSVAGRRVRVAKALTFMNNSGIAVRCLLQRFQVPLEDLLLVHDDIDLPLGSIRVSNSRGDAGHLGVRSVIEQLGSGQFGRLRIGIGKPQPGVPVRDYVLEEFGAEEMARVQQVVTRAAAAIHTVGVAGLAGAMAGYNAASSQVGEEA